MRDHLLSTLLYHTPNLLLQFLRAQHKYTGSEIRLAQLFPFQLFTAPIPPCSVYFLGLASIESPLSTSHRDSKLRHLFGAAARRHTHTQAHACQWNAGSKEEARRKLFNTNTSPEPCSLHCLSPVEQGKYHFPQWKKNHRWSPSCTCYRGGMGDVLSLPGGWGVEM